MLGRGFDPGMMKRDFEVKEKYFDNPIVHEKKKPYHINT
mgnify:CR=1 FL=1